MSPMLDYRSFFREEDPDAPREYWGDKAAGCIFIAKDTGRILLAHRSDRVDYEPNTWGTWGGKIDMDETPKQAVEREVEEETGFNGRYNISLLYVYRDGDFKYNNCLVIVPFEFKPQLNWENDSSAWVEFGEWPTPLHFGMTALITHAGSKIQHVVDTIKQRKKNMMESLDAPPAIVQSAHEFSPKFIDYMKSVENAGKVGFENGKWTPHISPEGGLPTIAYGHKLKKGEEKRFAGGLSDGEAERLLKKDLAIAKAKVYSDIKKMFDVQIPLEDYQEEMLTDYAFNLGSLEKFPKFVRAVLNKDWATAKREYERSYKDAKGVRQPLQGRNDIFFRTYLKHLKETICLKKAQQIKEDLNNYEITKQGLVDDGIYGYEIKSTHSYLRYGFEPTSRAFYLYNIGTLDPDERNRGYAKAILEFFFQMIQKAGGTLHIDSYTASGERYIKHIVDRLSQQYKVRLV